MKPNRIALLITGLLLTQASHPLLAQKAKSVPAAPAVTWVFDTKQDTYTNPHSTVYLRLGAKRIFITKTSSELQILPRAQYKDHKVPAEAITACSGWWAGQGEDLYVVRRGNYLDVYLRGLDEQADTPPYKRLKSISLR